MAGEGSVVVVGGGSGSGGGGTPGGSDKQVQYNNATAFGGISNGTSGQILTSGGASAVPAFADAPAGPTNTPAVSHQFLTAYNSTTKALAQAQPAFTDVSGSVAAAQLPNPSSSTLGGVQSKAAVSHNFLTAIGTDGTVSQAQPVTTDISGYVAGALVLLEEHTASASASLSLVTRNVTGQSGAAFQSDYDQYVITLVNIVPATNSVTLQVVVSTDGGSTYLGSTNYQFGYQYFGFGTADAGSNNSNGAAQFSICGTNIANTVQSSTTSGVNGNIQCFNPVNAAANKWFTWDVGVRLQSNNYHMYGGGSSEGTTALNALRILFSTGNIASGTIRLYGVAK
jgi:hypothetical protein